MILTQRYTIRDDDVRRIDQLLYDNMERMLEQQRETHDYTIDDLRQARLRNARIRRALRLKED